MAALVFACSSTDSSAPSDPEPESDSGSDARTSPRRDAGSETTDDAATCAPHALANAPSWHSPRPFDPTACSPTQISGYITSCVSGTQALCDAFRKQNPDCAACAYTSSSDPTWGPVVMYTEQNWIEANVGGCVALGLGETDSTGCGGSYVLSGECAIDSCSGCFPITSQDDSKAWLDCRSDKAIQSFCAESLAQANVKCAGISQTDSRVTKCAISTTFAETLRSYLTFWCSTTSDAGDGG